MKRKRHPSSNGPLPVLMCCRLERRGEGEGENGTSSHVECWLEFGSRRNRKALAPPLSRRRVACSFAPARLGAWRLAHQPHYPKQGWAQYATDLNKLWGSPWRLVGWTGQLPGVTARWETAERPQRPGSQSFMQRHSSERTGHPESTESPIAGIGYGVHRGCISYSLPLRGKA